MSQTLRIKRKCQQSLIGRNKLQRRGLTNPKLSFVSLSPLEKAIHSSAKLCWCWPCRGSQVVAFAKTLGNPSRLVASNSFQFGSVSPLSLDKSTGTGGGWRPYSVSSERPDSALMFEFVKAPVTSSWSFWTRVMWMTLVCLPSLTSLTTSSAGPA